VKLELPAPSVASTPSARLSLLASAWITTLAVSNLPNILIQELHLSLPISLLTLKLILLVGFFGLTFIWQAARPLRLYFAIFVILILVEPLSAWIGATDQWRGWFSGSAFSTQMLSTQLLRLGTALIMLAALALIYRRRSAFFFALGEVQATAAPIPHFIDQPLSWGRLGWISALCITLGTLAFLLAFGQAPLDRMAQILPLLPFVLLFAALNAFSEETLYRGALLAPLHTAVGSTHALLLTAALFGLWHFYGVPYGVIGVIMSGLLGWYLGKSMLETRGLFWAWFIHFWQDVAIFAFIAAGSITPGG